MAPGGARLPASRLCVGGYVTRDYRLEFRVYAVWESL
jgi:hypothetical protein